MITLEKLINDFNNKHSNMRLISVQECFESYLFIVIPRNWDGIKEHMPVGYCQFEYSKKDGSETLYGFDDYADETRTFKVINIDEYLSSEDKLIIKKLKES